MAVIHGMYLWQLFVAVIHGMYLWRLFVAVIYGMHLWPLFMAVIYGSYHDEWLVAEQLVILAVDEPGENWQGERYNGGSFELDRSWIKDRARQLGCRL